MIMRDHLHFLLERCRLNFGNRIFDHILRTAESYAEKGKYLREDRCSLAV
jgi:hypothetical protein